MQLLHESDEHLMQKVSEGAHAAYSCLLRRHADSVLTFLHRMTGDHHWSEELFQEVFLAVWIKRKTYKPALSFRSWLFGIAMNKCRHQWRTRRNSRVIADTDQTETAAGNAPEPSQRAIASEDARQIEQAVLRLPQQQRIVVVLRIWNGLSFQEIADVTSSNVSTARSNMFHALTTLRKWFEHRQLTP